MLVDVADHDALVLAQGRNGDSQRIDQRTLPAVLPAALRRGSDIDGVLDRPGAEQGHPVVFLQRTTHPRCRNGQDRGPSVHERARVFGKS